MENYNVLYYPHFQPSTRWLRAILLFTDSVTRIVPKDVVPEDSEELKELIQEIPDCVKSIAPNDSDIDIDDRSMQRMNKAFRQIAENVSSIKHGKVNLWIDGDRISVGGYTFLHERKVSERIRNALLENKLLDPKLQGIVTDSRTDETYLVPIQASNLILSHIADCIARRTGLDAVTDENLSFILNALNDMEVSLGRPTGATEGSLLSAIASINVPTR
jgi:hypothetical protein